MASATKSGLSGGGGTVAIAIATGWKMPKPSPIVVWRNAPGGESFNAIVTQINRNSISLMLFPPESRVGVPKDGVRFIDDPWNKTNGINADAGVWEFTTETLLLHRLAAQSAAA